MDEVGYTHSYTINELAPANNSEQIIGVKAQQFLSMLNLSDEQWPEILSSLASGLKWVEEKNEKLMGDAAKALWLSNSGGLVVVAGAFVKLEPVGWSVIALFAAVIAFVLGIYWGIDLHVRPAHRITTAQLRGMEAVLAFLRDELDPADIKSKVGDLLDEVGVKNKAITEYLVWAKRAFVGGTALGLLGVFLDFAQKFSLGG